MSSEVPIPEAAVELVVPLLTHVMTEGDAEDVAWDAVRAVAPLVVAAHLQALLDDAFPDEDSDYHYGCERLLDLVRDGIPSLRGDKR